MPPGLRSVSWRHVNVRPGASQTLRTKIVRSIELLMHSFRMCYIFIMVGIRTLIRTRWSGSLLAACVACLLAFQALVASVGLGMSTASPLGQPAFDICGALTTNGPDASAHNNGTDPSGHPLQCPYCFVAAQCTAHPTIVGDAKVFPAFAGRGVAAALYASVNHRAVYGRLHRTTGNPRGPPSFSV